MSTKIYETIVKPIITEKSNGEMEKGVYSFEVGTGASKIEIRKAVEGVYKVKVKKVNTLNMKGKKKRYGRIEGRTSDWKKAIVYLQSGQKIESLSA